MLVILITVSLGGHIVLENPGSSLIWLHDRFQWMLESLGSIGLKGTFLKGFNMVGAYFLARNAFLPEELIFLA